MRIIFLFMMFFLISQVNYATSDSFYNLVLNYENDGIFILIDVESDTYSGSAIVKNGQLYLFLTKSKGFDKERSKEFMKETLSKNDKLLLKPGDMAKYFFVKLNPVDIVDDNALKGKEYFIDYYFPAGFLKSGISYDERNAIIAKLFRWEIAAQVQDISGRLKIIKIDEDAVSPKGS